MTGNTMDIGSASSARVTRPASKLVISRIRSLNTSLSFKRSAANPRATLNKASPKPTQKPLVDHHDHSEPSQVSHITSLKKATFKWVKGELLGKGSYAQVYLALNATTGEIMAVKQVELPQTATGRSDSRQLEIIEALKFESDTLKDLVHRNIVQYLGYEESPKYMSIFLEYVPGGTISSCLRNHGRFSEEVTKSFTGQILVGLEYLHSRGILHRDLKADNILVEPTGICKISDFGISKNAGGRAYTNMKGTIFWMAPEILDSKEKGYDVKVDIWSVGCIVLEMWTGDRPWSGEELFPVMMKLFQHKTPPPVPSDIVLSEAALDFRRQCFQMDPQNRPSAAELQKHPYLRLPPGWRFESSEIQSSHLRRSSSMFSRKSRKSNKSIRPARPTDTPPVPQRSIHGTSFTRASDDRLRPLRMSSTTRNTTRHRRNQVPDKGPPIVYITPPGTPVQEKPQYPGDIPIIPRDSSDRSRKPGSHGIKGFRIINPDPEPEPSDPVYAYSPPPLPSTSSASPYSARLAPPSSHYIASVERNIFASSQTAGSSSQLRASVLSTQDNAFDEQNHSHWTTPRGSTLSPLSPTEGGHESDGYFWNKPPADLSPRSPTGSVQEHGNHHRSSTLISRIWKGKSVNRSTMHRDSVLPWATRPYFEEVYDHLQEFFPHHDLDKAVIDVGTVDAALEEHTYRKRQVSIRAVAEQVNRAQLGMRRRTKLWDSNVEELQMY